MFPDMEMELEEPSDEAKLWTVRQIAKFICDTEGDGSFRHLIYEYLDLHYADAYYAGGMVITNTLDKKSFRKWVLMEAPDSMGKIGEE